MIRRVTRGPCTRPSRQPRRRGPEPFLGVSAGHFVLPPAEHPNAKTTSRCRQAVVGESESNAKAGGEAVNSGEGIGCSTGSIGDSERIRKRHLSHSVHCPVARLSWNQKNLSRERHLRSDPDPSRSLSRRKMTVEKSSSQKSSATNNEKVPMAVGRISCRA